MKAGEERGVTKSMLVSKTWKGDRIGPTNYTAKKTTLVRLMTACFSLVTMLVMLPAY